MAEKTPTGLSEKIFETILQKLKVENHELVFGNNSSDIEDTTEDYVNRQNTICKKTIPSNNYQNNEKVSSVTESNSQKPENENECSIRQNRYMKTRLHSSNKKNLKVIPPRTLKTIHKCSERCNWCSSTEGFDLPVRTDQLQIMKEQNATLRNSHSMTPVDEGSRIKNIQKFEKNECKISSCSVSNCIQEAVHTLSIKESKIIQKIFSEFNFSFVIGPSFFSTAKERKQKSSLAFCDEHLRMVNVITVCQLCSNKVEKLDFEDYKMYDHWNSLLLDYNILLTLQPGMFICLTCKSCITDNDFLSPMNLKCLQENVKEKNSERIKTFGIVNHPFTIANKAKSMDLKVTFSEPLVTSTCIFKRSIREANKKKVIKNSKSKLNNRVNKIMNLLTNEDLEPEMENGDILEPNDEVQIKPEEEINPLEFNTILDLTLEEESDKKSDPESDHDENIKIKPDVDLSKYNSLANVPEILAINDNAPTDEDFKTIYIQDMVNDENEEIHQYKIKYKDGLEEINNYLPNYTKIFSDHGNSSLNEETNLLPIVTDVVSRQDLIVNDRDNICIDLTEDLSDSDDKSDQNNCDLLISRESKVRSNLSASLFEPGPVKPSEISNRNIQYSRFDNTLEYHKSIVNYYGNTSNSFDSSCDPIGDNTAQNITNKITVSDYIDVENLSSERDEELSMPLINPEEEEENILSSDEAELSPVNESNKLGLRIKNTTSLNPNFARPLRINRTLKKIPFYKDPSKLRKRKNSYSSDKSDDDSESETLYDVKSKTKPLEDNCKYFDMPRKTNTTSDINRKMKEFWNESLKVLTDQINDPNNPNKEILNNIAKKMDGNVNILKYLMENQQKLYDGKLIVSENADPEVAEYFKEHLESLKNIENFSDANVLMPSLSSSPWSKSSNTNVNFLPGNIISTTSNSISTPKNIVHAAHNLSDRCNNLGRAALKTSLPISSTRILNHSSIDSQKTTITNPNDNLYPQYKYTHCIKVPDTQCQSISQSRPFISKPRLLINQTRPPGIINSPPGLLMNQRRPIISCQPKVHPTFQLPTAVRSKPLSYENILHPKTVTVKNLPKTRSKYPILKKPINYFPKQ